MKFEFDKRGQAPLPDLFSFTLFMTSSFVPFVPFCG